MRQRNVLFLGAVDRLYGNVYGVIPAGEQHAVRSQAPVHASPKRNAVREWYLLPQLREFS